MRPTFDEMADLPEHIERAITTPHAHEGEHNKPLWILWKHEIAGDGLSDGPLIDSICDTEYAARYNAHGMIESWGRPDPYGGTVRFFVERIPANHRFASSIADALEEHVRSQIKVRKEVFKYPRDGD